LLEAADAARAKWLLAVGDQRKDAGDVRKLMRGLKKLVGATFGEQSAIYADFGYAPPRPGKKTAATKAAAVVKTKATREARHTMGPRQRLSVKAAVATLGAAASNGVAANGVH
jgi:hypothetical protein